MTRASIATIDEAVNAAVAREMDAPTIPVKDRERAAATRRLKIVSGFLVADETEAARAKVLDDAARERRQKVEEFYKDRNEISVKLEKLGITALAVWPKEGWNQICARAGLYRLNPTADGKVNVAGEEKLNAFERRAVWLNVFLWLGMVAAISMLIARAVYYGDHPDGHTPMGDAVGAFFGISLLLTLIGGIVLTIATDGAVFIRTHSLLTRLQMRAYRFKPHARLLRDFFPGGVSPVGSKMRATLVLPTPPQEVADILLKAQGLALKVGAVAEAIAFVETPAQILRKEQAERVELRKRLWADPIIYVEHGGAVAIIAQFGDFPIEQRVVDYVVGTEHLI